MAHPLDAVHYKLERANENILNLEREIRAFLGKDAHRVIPNDEPEAVQEAVNSHADRIIPVRFNILSGEIIHHLRSCLDHIAWELSSKDSNRIEFPVFITEPVNATDVARYEGKVKGIGPVGRAIIDAMQPYNRKPAMLTGPPNHPLWLIHDLDLTDKHRELILTQVSFNIPTGGMAGIYNMLHREAQFPESYVVSAARAFDPNCKITTEISFAEFGGRKIQPVIPGLKKLTRYVHSAVVKFAAECF